MITSFPSSCLFSLFYSGGRDSHATHLSTTGKPSVAQGALTLDTCSVQFSNSISVDPLASYGLSPNRPLPHSPVLDREISSLVSSTLAGDCPQQLPGLGAFSSSVFRFPSIGTSSAEILRTQKLCINCTGGVLASIYRMNLYRDE